jgi:hypothetical protein
VTTPLSGGTYRLFGESNACAQSVEIELLSTYRNGEADVRLTDLTDKKPLSNLRQWPGQAGATNGVDSLDPDPVHDGWVSFSSGRTTCAYQPIESRLTLAE